MACLCLSGVRCGSFGTVCLGLGGARCGSSWFWWSKVWFILVWVE